MKTSEILNYLKLIESELTDAYNTAPDTPETSDTLYYIDTARDLVGELTHNIENNITISDKESHDFNEAINGPDGLPLNFPFGDGEGRLKGRN